MKLWIATLATWAVVATAVATMGGVGAHGQPRAKDPTKKMRSLAADIAISAVEAGTDMTSEELVTYSVDVSRGIYSATFIVP